MSNRTWRVDRWVGSIAYRVGSTEPQRRSAEGKPNHKPQKADPHQITRNATTPLADPSDGNFFLGGYCSGIGHILPARSRGRKMHPNGTPVAGGWVLQRPATKWGVHAPRGRRQRGGTTTTRPKRRDRATPKPAAITRVDAPFGEGLLSPDCVDKGEGSGDPADVAWPRGLAIGGIWGGMATTSRAGGKGQPATLSVGIAWFLGWLLRGSMGWLLRGSLGLAIALISGLMIAWSMGWCCVDIGLIVAWVGGIG